MSQGKSPVVLLIEADSALRRIISLGLQMRNIHVIEIAAPGKISDADIHQLDMIVVDVDAHISRNWSCLEALQNHAQLSQLPKIVLAWEYPVPVESSVSVATLDQISYLTKPFDARALHQVVDQLLLEKAKKQELLESRVEEQLLASYGQRPVASIWPLVTAAGLLLAVIGLLAQITLTAVGFVIVFASLLLWTLEVGGKSEKVPIGV